MLYSYRVHPYIGYILIEINFVRNQFIIFIIVPSLLKTIMRTQFEVIMIFRDRDCYYVTGTYGDHSYYVW